ncbi:unnamed protein product [Cylicocyclus nassatus]|uniref:Large ribosomal subunit protein uL10m n=1 Tax=Cylicocyclus nassatus TaxID=53992 RepID=A0AA36MAL5_CYLNA|nr:unnamed protein product [Cylicocyclus nassatus]
MTLILEFFEKAPLVLFCCLAPKRKNQIEMIVRRLHPASICAAVQITSTRLVSSKYPRPKPRPYRRRLYEAAVAPVLPDKLKVCTRDLVAKREKVEYDPVELALSTIVKKWMISEEYRVMAICQFLPVSGRTLWLSKNQLRLKGVEFRTYGNKIMKKVFEGTPLSALEPVLVGFNATLYGKDINALKVMQSETLKLNWIVPLVYVVDSRILAKEDVDKFCAVGSLEDHRAETVQILSSQLRQLTTSLDSQSHQLTATLDQVASRPKS